MRSREGRDLPEGSVSGEEPLLTLEVMVERIRVRDGRRLMGLPLAPINPSGLCDLCGEFCEGGKTFVACCQEWVEVHPRCAQALPRSRIRVTPKASGSSYEIS